VVAGFLTWLFFATFVMALLPLFLREHEVVRNATILVAAMLLVLGGIVALPLHLSRYLRRETPRLLGPAADAHLRAGLGIESWGRKTTILLDRSVPTSEIPELTKA
jgi:hypothetical protein